MGRKTRRLIIAAIILGLAVYIGLQERNLRLIKNVNATLQDQLAQLKVETTNAHYRTQADLAELDQARSEKSELLRLRNEVAQLRRKVQEISTANTANLTRQSGAGPLTHQNDLPYHSYTAAAQTTLDWGKTLLIGGWTMKPGSRTYLFISPENIDPAGNIDPTHTSKQITLETKAIEVPEKALEQLGMDQFRTEGQKSAVQAILTDERFREFLTNVEKISDVNILNIPRVTTLDNRQTQVGVWDVKHLPSGEEYRLGPGVDIVPHILNDGHSVSLSVYATVNNPKRSEP